jgi:hypothetical protein
MKQTSTLGRLVIAGLLLLILGGSCWLCWIGWQSLAGTQISLGGIIGMVIGIFLTIALAVGLMGASFYSARKGIDDDAVYQPGKHEGDE